MWSSALTAVSFCALATASPLAIRQSSTEAQPLTYDTSICPGYTASNVSSDGTTITADLTLAGTACNAFSNDLTTLRLMVKYETNNRLHLQIYDPNEARYEVPEEVFPRPNDTSADASTLRFEHVDSPFSFAIIRNSTGEALFNSSGTSLVFENQYWRLRTTLPDNPNIYGLGEHTDPFHLPTEDYVRTMWSRDAFGIPNGTNLYGSHPVYSDYRETGTHSVALVNSNGMDIILNRTETGNYLEYNVIGGIIDLYFMEGPTPIEAAKQYAQLSGLPASIPYWGLGFHQCRYGYRDYVEVAQVIQNYSAAGIPLETQWTDIDYMYRRQVFTLDPEYFPLSGVQEVVNYLHANNQHYIVMVDPAVGILPGPPGETESAYTRGLDADVFMRYNESTLFYGVVWPGPTVYPDWFASNTTSYWNAEFSRFFDASSGVDIDGLWIDMNEPANFQNYCDAVCQQNPEAGAIEQAQISGNPPNRTTSPPAPGTPAFGSSASNMTRRSFNFDLELRADSLLEKRQSPTGASGSLGEGVATRANTTALNYISPGYTIGNVAGSLSNKSSDTNLVHQNGQIEYNTHNLYGSMMSEFSREAMLNRRPGLKTLVITRSTFLGAGRFVGKWLGDNLSNWQQYRESISGVLGFAAIQNMPVVGADVCGFGDNTTETLCARWASLGAFAYPFFRDHSNDGTIYQELYRWPIVAETARKAIGMRMRLLDYIYTGLHLASVDGTPLVQPLFFQYPTDLNTAPITLQLFMGSSLLVSPVTEENATSVTFYLPDDRFYDLFTFAAVEGAAANVTLEVPITDIPVHIKSGSIIPMRNESAMTTTELRTLPFQLVVAPSRNGTAIGSLYLDDGVSIEQAATTEVEFAFNNNTLSITGQVGYTQGATLASVLFLGQSAALNATSSDGMSLPSTFNATSSVITVDLGNMTMAAMEITLA